MTIFHTVTTPIGGMVIAANNDFLLELKFTNKASLDQEQHHLEETNQSPNKIIDLTIKQLIHYFSGQPHTFSLPLYLPTTNNFQSLVLKKLLQIPYGQTMSYSDIAHQIGRPKAYQAVANACAHNKLAIIIPCHRVISKNGSLGGYNAGILAKKKLLQLEKVINY